jgi:flagellar M-ring protein FliF
VARSEQRSTESSRDESGRPEGVPGVRSNQPGGAPEAAVERTASTSSRTSETTNYEISKRVSHRVDPVGKIQRLDVAVLVDGRSAPEPGPEGAEAPAGEAAFVPWSEQEIEQFQALAMRAVGFDPERGDKITVTSAPFRSIPLDPPEGGLDLDPHLLMLAGTVLNFLGWALAVLLFARFVGKPLVTALTSRPPAARASGLPLTAAEFEAELSGGPAEGALAGAAAAELPPPPRPPLTLAEQVSSIARARRDDSVKTLRGWLDQ